MERTQVEVAVEDWLTTDQAASRLGVKATTLYAYVSRGQLRRRTASDGRRSEYHPGDVADLAVRGRRARPTRPSDIVVPTAITRIGDDGPSYRGQPAVDLAGRVPFEAVARWLWAAGGSPADREADGEPLASWLWAAGGSPAEREADGESMAVATRVVGVEPWRAPAEALEVARAAVTHLPAGTRPPDLLLPAVAALRNADPLRSDLRGSVVVASGERLLAVLASVVARGASGLRVADRLAAAIVPVRDDGGARAEEEDARSVDADGARPVGEDARSFDADGARPVGEDARSVDADGARAADDGVSVAAALIDAALVLLSDHELAASTLAVRVAASARCDPYAAVIAGLAVVSGHRHGAASRPLEQAMARITAGRDAASALQESLRGDILPGFGHPLYPQGDPRAARLMELLRESPLVDRIAPMEAVIELADDRGLPPPNIDVALAGLTHAIGAAPGSGELLFAMARIAGWLAHALEQYGEPQLLRPTAVYVGT